MLRDNVIHCMKNLRFENDFVMDKYIKMIGGVIVVAHENNSRSLENESCLYEYANIITLPEHSFLLRL